ncbi:GPI-anchored CFEM domain protein A-like [Cottoperca gobio]|uniref:GPI-anchored CFEM domain protein A-like n=1 Tax=Cottoperca gobio TaxID=56716 RepID=A0A6J2RXV9_COTGO|nr:GPI-anchored CFEM domain protein A-like [Cottoperca gobio]
MAIGLCLGEVWLDIKAESADCCHCGSALQHTEANIPQAFPLSQCQEDTLLNVHQASPRPNPSLLNVHQASPRPNPSLLSPVGHLCTILELHLVEGVDLAMVLVMGMIIVMTIVLVEVEVEVVVVVAVMVTGITSMGTDTGIMSMGTGTGIMSMGTGIMSMGTGTGIMSMGTGTGIMSTGMGMGLGTGTGMGMATNTSMVTCIANATRKERSPTGPQAAPAAATRTR